MPPAMPAAPVARLALEDGSVFTGRGFGACGEPRTHPGEVVFNTAMTGYQEALTDPSYAGQILTFTAPMIGNYGVCREDVESGGPQVAGFVIRELARRRSNHRAIGDLSEWLAEAGVPGLEGVDTRALVRRLRIEGAMRGVISCDPAAGDGDLVELARRSPRMAGRNLAAEVSPAEVARWAGASAEGRGGLGKASRALRVLALDCGAKQSIYRRLSQLGCEVTAAPHDLDADRILGLEPAGLLVSNGPGDPAAVSRTIEQLRRVAGRIPTFGICLGHQMLALALGASAYKLRFGHRGANQPVRNLLTGRVEITSQNHGFCVEADSLAGIDCEVTHVHLNDGTLAGFRHRSKPILCVQYHPEAAPGPRDSAYLFDCFIHMMRTRRPIDAEAMREAQAGALRG
ncbi:MAG: glutamine-hydrolyzing carbamoyl-phosphate synthase small subunit [Planctomycetota bacterium]|jgi:carbamoyl-phosphate synthase small subunit